MCGKSEWETRAVLNCHRFVTPILTQAIRVIKEY